ncbi:UNVERIFIED_CONTAM: hypothetical protein Sangu_1971500 [Sesamum angustifolium]|uniref:Uncharacterized protein n=1 Tax=Sesamum angustifolium TaxID=2727405 RepID=A0AAW2LW07_9LAMI
MEAVNGGGLSREKRWRGGAMRSHYWSRTCRRAAAAAALAARRDAAAAPAAAPSLLGLGFGGEW